MAKEPSFFAQRYSEFLESFPTDESCARYMVANGWNSGRNCTHCGENDFIQTVDFRIYNCVKCGKPNKIFEGTILFRVRKLRAWFAGHWFLSRGVFFSGKEFSVLLGVALDTAQRISHTISIHLIELMNGLPSVSTAFFQEIFGRRSSETPAKQHPVTEQAEIEKKYENPAEKTLDDVGKVLRLIENSNLSTDEKCVLEMLEHSEYKSIDELADNCSFEYSDLLSLLTMLEIKGLIQSAPGHIFRLVKAEKTFCASISESCSVAVQAFVRKVKSVNHGISRKNLQLYLALFWSTVHLDIWRNNDLLFELLDKEPLAKGVIRNYVSPLNVFVPQIIVNNNDNDKTNYKH